MQPKDDSTVRRDVQDLLSAKTNQRKASLVIIAGHDIGRKFPISQPETLVGRGETCGIFINDEDVSRQHAKVISSDQGIKLEDLGSTNGTLVNGVKIHTCLLQDGDRVQFGNVTVLKFHLLDALEDQFNEQLYLAANKDALTSIYNKKYFMDRLRMEISYTKRHLKPLSLIILDIDFFKKVNDTYGHIVGDEALRFISRQIDSIKRQEDLFARFGGEEFVLLLRETNKPSAVQFADKIRAYIESVPLEFENLKIPLTVSIGVETFTGMNFSDEDHFLRSADEFLYKAKKDGRNLVRYELGE